MKNLEYVILDIETTGFSPKRGDKIVELGALVVNEQGVVVKPSPKIGTKKSINLCLDEEVKI